MTKPNKKKASPLYELISNKDMWIFCEWVQAQSDACLQRLHKEIFNLRERVQELEDRANDKAN